MDKYELYAIGHYLTEWPEEWSYKQIIDELKDGDNGMATSVHYHYEGIPPEDLAGEIDQMTESLRNYFK